MPFTEPRCTCNHSSNQQGFHYENCVLFHLESVKALGQEVAYAQASDEFAEANQGLTEAVKRFNTAKLRLELILSTWKLEPKNAP